MNILLKKVYEKFYPSQAAKKDSTRITNLAEFFKVSKESLTDEFLLEKLLTDVAETVKKTTERNLEKDFSNRMWFEANKGKVEAFPDFVRLLMFENNIPEKEQ